MSEAVGSIQLVVNGERRPAPPGQGLLEFVASLGLHPASVLIERNGAALLRDEWPAVRLAEGDQLEILRVVAGG